MNKPQYNKYSNLFLVADNWLVNPDGPVVMDSVCTSKACIAAAKLLYGVTNDNDVLTLPQDWALNSPEDYLMFFTPENMTFNIAAEVGANLNGYSNQGE